MTFASVVVHLFSQFFEENGGNYSPDEIGFCAPGI